MDVQLKRGMVEACVLAVLKRGDSYGWQIIKDISQCMELSESTLYPVLKRLEASKCLTVYSLEHNGRLRKYYRLTEEGQQKLAAFAGEWKQMVTIYQFITEHMEGEPS